MATKRGRSGGSSKKGALEKLMRALHSHEKHSPDEWKKRQKGLSPVRVLEDWCNAPFDEVPDLLSPELQILTYETHDLGNEADVAFSHNSFQLLGKCFRSALACYRQTKGHRLTEHEFDILLALSVRAMYFEDFRNVMSRFFVEELNTCSRMPVALRRRAAEQFIMLYWAVDREWYRKLYEQRTTKPLFAKSDLLQRARRKYDEVEDALKAVRKAKEIETQLGCPIYSFNSTKGGTGKTTLACALAMGYALAGERVGLLDLDVSNPSVLDSGVIPGVRQAKIEVSIEDLLVRGSRPSTKMLDKALLRTPVPKSVKSPDVLAEFRRPRGELLVMSCLGITKGKKVERRRDLHHAMLNEPLWLQVLDNLGHVLTYLRKECMCDRIILDNMPGIYEFPLAIAAFTAGLKGTGVFVATLDRTDLGNWPETIFSSLNWLKGIGGIVMVLDRVATGELDPELLDKKGHVKVPKLVHEAFAEAVLRQGLTKEDFHRVFGKSAQITSDGGIYVDTQNFLLKHIKKWLTLSLAVDETLQAFWYPRNIRKKTYRPWDLIYAKELQAFFREMFKYSPPRGGVGR